MKLGRDIIIFQWLDAFPYDLHKNNCELRKHEREAFIDYV